MDHHSSAGRRPGTRIRPGVNLSWAQQSELHAGQAGSSAERQSPEALRYAAVAPVTQSVPAAVPQGLRPAWISPCSPCHHLRSDILTSGAPTPECPPRPAAAARLQGPPASASGAAASSPSDRCEESCAPCRRRNEGSDCWRFRR